MHIIATGWTWWPSLNPLGAWSAGAALISAATWFLVDHRLLRSERAHGWLTVAAPLLLLGLVFFRKVYVDPNSFGLAYGWPYRRYEGPDASDYMADYIFIAVALVLARKAAWLPSWDLRAFGTMAAVVGIVFLSLECHLLYRVIYAGTFRS
jgi:hypothetical protein